MRARKTTRWSSDWHSELCSLAVIYIGLILLQDSVISAQWSVSNKYAGRSFWSTFLHYSGKDYLKADVNILWVLQSGHGEIAPVSTRSTIDIIWTWHLYLEIFLWIHNYDFQQSGLWIKLVDCFVLIIIFDTYYSEGQSFLSGQIVRG